MTITTTGIAGAGAMGAGIAHVFAQAGFEVVLFDINRLQLEKARAVISKNLEAAVAKGKLKETDKTATLGRITFSEDINALKAGLIVEAIAEKLEAKKQLFQRLAEINGAETILATNTSSIPVTRIAKDIPHPERVAGMHFFNPVWSLHLVELIRGQHTSENTIQKAKAIAATLGKQTILVKNMPGFATSRLDLIASLEAMRMVQEGVASAEDIDLAATVAYRHPMGPLRLSDVVGLDVRLDIAQQLSQTLGERYEPPRILREMVARGELGQKSGKGFFDWSSQN